MREINNFAGEIQSTVDRTSATFELVQRLRQTQRRQAAVGSMAVLLLLGFAAILLYYKKSFLEHEAPHDSPRKPQGPQGPANRILRTGTDSTAASTS